MADGLPVGPGVLGREAAPFQGLTFAGVVSLGGNCETAHWLRAFGRHGVRGPFDWLVTPLDAVSTMLADDGARLGTQFAIANAGTSVRCRAYDVLYHHEFPRGVGDAVLFDAPAIAACRGKLTHKWASLVRACERAVAEGAPMLFLRLWGGTDLPWDRIGPGKAPLRAADLNAVAAALAGRFPGLDFRLLVGLPEPAPQSPAEAFDPAGLLDPRVAVRVLPRGQDPAWATEGAAWGCLLASLRFRDPPAATALGETLHWSGEDAAEPALSGLPAAEGDGTDAAAGAAIEAAIGGTGRVSGATEAGVMAQPAETVGLAREHAHARVALACRLRDALAAARPGGGAPAETARAALVAPNLPATLRQRAGQVLVACGLPAEALSALRAAHDDAPGLPGIAGEIAAVHEVLGQDGEALAWARRAAAENPLTPGVYARLVRLQVRAGEADGALADLSAALEHRVEAPALAIEAGRALWAAHRPHHAVEAFASAFRLGVRDADFLRDHLGLLTGETRYAEVLETAARIGPFDDGVRSRRLMLTGHARLALARPREAAIAAVAAREAGDEWLGPEAVLGRARAAREAGRPFALVRLGDGEARFLIARRPDLRPGVTPNEAAAIGAVVWENWFGEPMTASPEADRAELEAALTRTVAAADVVGVTGAARLRSDTGHYGYLAALEAWLAGLRTGAGASWTDALCPAALDRSSPFLGTVLEGADFVGVVSPHRGLAAAMAARFGIAGHAEHVVPAEGRLPTAGASRALGRHFPDLYRATLAALSVPRPGAVFLVAAGLLGKVYCGRIRELGGVALDIGALADAWMGFDTRDGQLAGVGRLGPA